MLPAWVPRLPQRRGVARFDGIIYDFFTIAILRRAASRRHSIEGARSSKCPFKLLLASLDRFPSADGMYFHTFRRRRQAPLSTHIGPSGCTAPICVRRPSSTSVPSLLSGPFRASRGRSPGATVAPPPGMGWTLRTGISPRGPPKVTRGEVPKVLDCRTTKSFWVTFWYTFFGPTCTQFYKKYQNGVPKSCQKGGRLLPQQSPNNRPQQSPPKPI